MSPMRKIQERLAPELAEMNAIIERSLATSNKMMDDIVTRYLRVKGKQIRPILVILSAKMFGRVTNEVLYAGAALEMLHNASLIHDDVVDETMLRRGEQTINSLLGNQIAVLVGDYFVSNALAAGIHTGKIRVISALSALGKELSLGEIDQICNSHGRHLEEESYFSMIRQKTASLFMNCVRMGADVVDAPEAEKELLVRYAELLGLCFQIKDDIFDYYDNPQIGKPTGNDLREGKVTLPLLYALRSAPASVSERMRALLTEGNLSAEDISVLISFAKEYGGIEYSFATMRKMQAEANNLIEQLPDSEARSAIKEIFEYIISRDK